MSCFPVDINRSWHIERYKCMKDIELVEYLVNKGAYMQVNATV